MRLARSFAAVALSTTLLAACFTGKRPSLQPPEVPVDDPAIAAVLLRLDMPVAGAYTAGYTILTKLTAGGAPTPTTTATVSQADLTSKSITIGTVRYLDQTSPQTCDLTAATCVPLIDDAKVSNLLIGHDFYNASPAAKLRQDSTTTIGAAVASTRDIAGQTATCAQVSFASGTKTYCAIDGLLAAQDTPDVQIDLVSYAATSDPALFATTTVPG